MFGLHTLHLALPAWRATGGIDDRRRGWGTARGARMGRGSCAASGSRAKPSARARCLQGATRVGAKDGEGGWMVRASWGARWRDIAHRVLLLATAFAACATPILACCRHPLAVPLVGVRRKGRLWRCHGCGAPMASPDLSRAMAGAVIRSVSGVCTQSGRPSVGGEGPRRQPWLPQMSFGE